MHVVDHVYVVMCCMQQLKWHILMHIVTTCL